MTTVNGKLKHYVDGSWNEEIKNTNIDTLTAPGRYYMYGSSTNQNAPFEGYLDVYSVNENFIKQVAHSAFRTETTIAIRTKQGGTWSAWKITNLNNVPDVASGTWTPVFPRDTATNVVASWVRIGTIIFITAQWRNVHIEGQGNSYINVTSLPVPSGYSYAFGIHGSWHSNNTDAGGEIGQATTNGTLWFSKAGVHLPLVTEWYSFSAFGFLVKN